MTDFNLHMIFQLDINFQSLQPFAGSNLSRPSGLAVDAAGNILVCDTRNNSLKIYNPAGGLVQELRNIGSSSIQLPLDIAVMKAGYLALLHQGRVQIF